MQNLVEKIEVIEFNNRDYWIQPIQKYPAVLATFRSLQHQVAILYLNQIFGFYFVIWAEFT